MHVSRLWDARRVLFSGGRSGRLFESGEIVIDGSGVIRLDQNGLRGLRRYKVSMVFQNFGLLLRQIVLDNAAYVPRMCRASAARSAATRSMPRAPGCRRRGSTAMPTTTRTSCRAACGSGSAWRALDPLIRAEMQDPMLRLQATLNKTTVFITHDLDEALRLGNKIAILRDGTPDDILPRPADDDVRRFGEADECELNWQIGTASDKRDTAVHA
ncbi:hypothetical protein [Burkholderia stagnalis]